ncbi:MAG TPA: hypothetical protein VFR97_12950 [Capillimicrobium sp.]|nr:hypothetical protein [Capillimicrobium sp.]
MLADGTHVVALVWPTGRRLARTGPSTRWSVDEHFGGEPPLGAQELVDRLWQRAVNALVDAIHAAAREGR